VADVLHNAVWIRLIRVMVIVMLGWRKFTCYPLKFESHPQTEEPA